MKIALRLAVLALAMAPVAALGDNSPHIVLATPGIGGGAIERFTVRFSQPMVALGDPRAAMPFDVTCPIAGAGRWVDPQTFVYAFDKPLPGGAKCEFKTKAGVRSVAGYGLETGQSYTVDSGGPIARAVLPDVNAGNADAGIEEDQVFLVAANLAPTPQSVAANAYCAVDGIGEKIPVAVLKPEVPARLLGAMSTDDWAVRNFLERAGLPQTLPEKLAERQASLSSVIAVRCLRPLPPGRDVSLVWGAGVAGAGGQTAGIDQRFDFTVRKPFTASFTCSRVNPQAGCSPVEKAQVSFSAPVPMSVAQAIRIQLADGKQIAPRFSDDDKKSATIDNVSFAAPLPYATKARLVLPVGIKDESGRPLSNAERFPLDIRFDTAPPLVKFAAPFGILELKEGGVLPVTVRNVEPELQGQTKAIGGQTLKVGDSDAEVAMWLRKVKGANERKSDQVKKPGGGDDFVEVERTGDTPVLAGGSGAALKVGLPGKGKDFEVVGIPLAKPGFYVVELASPLLGQALLGRNAPRYVTSAALVTNLAVHFEWGRERSLAWVTALDTGAPVGDARVQVTDSCTGKLLAKGVTDGQGGLFIPAGIPQPDTDGDCGDDSSAHPLMVSARANDDFSFTLTDWGEGIAPYDFDLTYGYDKPTEIIHTIFDRTLLRQGETIHMKQIVRNPRGDGFALTPGFTGTLRLSHRGSDTSFDVPLTIDANGVGETQWTAPTGAPMGDYDLSVVAGDKTIDTGQSFKVDEYKLPTMRATVTGPKDAGATVRPKTVPLDLFVGYLSGGGASNLPVEVRVGYFAGDRAPDGYESYTFGSVAVAEGVKPLNPDGDEDATSLPPTQTLPGTLRGDGTQQITVDIPELDRPADMLVEMDYQDANGETLTSSKRIPIYASGVQLGLKTDGWLMKQDDLRLKFVALGIDGRPRANQTIQVALYGRQILTARRRLIGGFYAYDNQMKTTKLAATCSATTDAQGLASCQIDPGVSGEVYAVATTADAAGNVARAATSIWLAGQDDWWFGGDNGDRMDLVPEKLAYNAGETARFQVRMPFRSAHVLVSVEREGVLASYVTELSGTDPVIEVPMPGSYAPDVYVSVLAVRGRAAPTGWEWWDGVRRFFGWPTSPDDAKEPTATVDLAKPSYRLGIAKVKVGWDAHQLQVAVKADKERYAAKSTAQVDITVKRSDGGPARTADVAFVAVDQALLQLSPNDSWKLLDAMMGDRPLSVLTSTAQTQVVGRRHYGKKAVPAGGGGGGDLSGLNRENFQPVLLWRGRVALDANGRAHVPVPLNDALSSFRLVAIATDGAQLFGSGSADIRTAQDLTIYAGLPGLVRTGDQYAAGFTLRNGSDKPMTVTANVDLVPAVARGGPITVTIPAGGATPIAWNLTAPADPGQLRWQVTARAKDGKAGDRLTTTQDVIPVVPLEVWAATLARVGPGTSIMIQPPAGALAGRGVVDVKLSDTLAPPLEGVRAYMTDYPYNCFEQRLSRVVALGDAGGWARLAGEIPVYQAPDGLLRYFPNDAMNGSEALTAYVLALTADAGLPIPDAQKTRMIEAMKAVIDGRLRHEDYGDVRLQRLTAFNALARAGAATPAMLGQIGLGASDMPTGSLADYLVALDKVPGLANAAQLRRAAEAELRGRLVFEGTRLDLSDADKAPWWLMSSADEGAIKALIATLGRPGWNDDAPRMMVGVALRQRRGHWDTTPANAWGAVAARKFGALYPASAITGATTLAFGPQTLTRAWPLAVDARSARFPMPSQPMPLMLKQAAGAGPWATVSVSAAVPLTRPLANGYTLTKRVEVVKGTAGKLGRGDVLKVTLSVTATAERNWVVVNDPIPAGATVIGDQGNESTMLAASGNGDNAQPSYVERGRDAWRAYFAWVPKGNFTVSYTMRLNGAGRFNLPPTKVEAMYSPAVKALVPNAAVTIAQR